jgi:hypothetical protein
MCTKEQEQKEHIFEVMRKYVTTLFLLQQESDSGMRVISNENRAKMLVELDDYITELNCYFLEGQ